MEKIKPLESQEKEKKIFVEIGMGSSPVIFLSSEKAKKLKEENAIYVGIEFDEKEMVEGLERLKKKHLQIPNEDIFLIRANALRLPFGNDQVGEIFIGNVFGDPSVSRWEVKGLLKEIFRVLKRGGVLKILESYTPDVGKKQLLDALEEYENKFEVEKQASLGDEELNTYIEKEVVGLPNEKGSFVCYLRKV